MEKQDYYKTLGVDKSASDDTIKKAFRKLSMKYHPDRQAGKSEAEKKEAEDKFKEIAEAYEVLSNKEKRQHYDQFGFDGPQMSGMHGFDASGFDINEFMRRHAGMFGHGFGGMHFGFGDEDEYEMPSREPDFKQPEDGQNVQINIYIPFKDAINGCEKSFEIKLTKECPHCHGSGIDNSVEPEKCPTCKGTGQAVKVIRNGFMIQQIVSECPDCHGVGWKVKYCTECNGSKRVLDTKNISVKIPQGIEDQQRLRIIGAGHCGVKGGRNGNLYIMIHIIQQPIFERFGANVKTNVFIDPITASLGGKAKVASPYGIIEIDIPAGTSSGKQMIFDGKGIKLPNITGKLIVNVVVEPFSKLTSKQKELLKSLQSSFTSENLPNAEEYLKAAADVV